MIFFLLLNDICVAPLASPAPIPNGKLLQVQLLIRHGERAPGENFTSIEQFGDWECDGADAYSPMYNPAPIEHPKIYHTTVEERFVHYKPSCRDKDLTVNGMKQHYELGKMFKDYLYSTNRIIPENYDPARVLIRATEKDRTLRSAISFVQGLYPPVSPNEVVNIVTGSTAGSLLHPSKSWCSELASQEADLLNSEEFKEQFDKYKSMFSQFINPDPKTAKKFAGFYAPIICSDRKLPSEITSEVAEKIVHFNSYWNQQLHMLSKYQGVGAAPLMREMFKVADEFIAGMNQYSFALFSSHDTGIAALNGALGYFPDYVPFRAHVAFELWDVKNKIICRFVENGKPVPVSLMDGATEFTYSDFKTRVAMKGYLEHCKVPEE